MYLEGRLAEPLLVPAAGGTAVVYTCPSPSRGAAPNEDALAVFELGPATAVLAVADGLGGHSHGEEASRTALELLAEQLERADAELALEDRVLAAIRAANERLLARDPSPATTLVVAIIHEGELRGYTVGDSELMICGQRGKLKLRTIAHSPVGYAFSAGALDERSALLHHERHYISNVVGMPDMHISATGGIQLSARDTVVLGSDGLFDNLYQAEIIDLVRAGEPVAQAERLAGQICARMRAMGAAPSLPSKPDDLAFILFRPHPPSASTRARSRP